MKPEDDLAEDTDGPSPKSAPASLEVLPDKTKKLSAHPMRSRTHSQRSLRHSVAIVGRCSLLRRMRRPIKAIVRTPYFEIWSILVILYSTVVMGIEVDHQRERSKFWQDYISYSNLVINLSFVIEWVLRFSVASEGLYWVLDWTNALFTMAAIGPWILLAVNVSWLNHLTTPLRWVRLFKVVHTVKNVRQLRTIWLLISGLYASLPALISSMTTVGLITFFFGILSVDVIGMNPVFMDCQDTGVWTANADPLNPRNCPGANFQSLSLAVRSMSHVMMGDHAVDLLLSLQQRYAGIWIFFFLFQILTRYTLFNLVLAVITNNAFKIVSEDELTRVMELEMDRQNHLKELVNLLRMVDADGGGKVSLKEFEESFETPALRNKLVALGIQEAELKHLFLVIRGDNNSEMDIEHFCEGLLECFGEAKSYTLLKAQKKVEKTKKYFASMFEELEGTLNGPSSKMKAETPSSLLEDYQELESEVLQLELEMEERLGALGQQMVETKGLIQGIAECFHQL